jgi:hemerythrin
VKNALYIVWQPTNGTGIPIIDEQHRGIVSAINSLHYFLQRDDAAAAYTPTMDVLRHYTNVHFQTEEALIREAGIAGYADHVALHKAFLDQLRSMEDLPSGDDEARQLLASLKAWWLDHINHEDRQYVVAVKKRLGIPV